MKNIIKRFIVGSSFPVFIYFFFRVRLISKNYKYEDYSIIAPFYLGIMNIIAGKIGYINVGILSPLIVISFAYLTKSYNFNKKEWIEYSIRIIITHFIMFNLIVKNLQSLF